VAKATVILRRCESYDAGEIARIIGDGMEALGALPSGRTMVKPNCVIAHPRFFPHAFTRSEFLDGLLAALRRHGQAIRDLSVGERCGITIPTRYVFAEAGYLPVLRRHSARADYFDEGPQVERTLSRPGALRKTIFIPEGVARCDFLVNAPKLKAHPWTGITLALKNYIGLQDDAHRLIDHDWMLNAKIADLQEVISPGLIAVDAIVAGERSMLTPSPFPLGLIILGVNPVAVDAVGARIVGLDPCRVDHIRISAERGTGSLAEDEIEIAGDLTLDEARERARGLRLTLERVDKIFNGVGGNLALHVGPPPDPQVSDYCWGGCPGSLYESMETLRVIQPNVYHEIRPMRVVFGHFEGRIDAAPGERVLFVGDCARFSGEISGRKVEIPSRYVRREEKDPRRARSGDAVAKMLGVIGRTLRSRGEPAVRAPGCPVSIAETVLYLAFLGGTVNPYLHPSILFRFIYFYAISKLVKAWRRAIARGGKEGAVGAKAGLR
jgi:uncharacterized protein (DUF362 family)